MKIEAKKLKCVEIFCKGKSIGVFIEKSQWNGLSELRRIGDENRLIVGGFSHVNFTSIFAEILGVEHDSERTYIVSASPDLISEIKALETPGEDR